jgi:hypothetical protein
MARPIIASKLIRSVRNRALIPTDTSTYQDEDILDILNEEVTQGLLSTIMSLNEEHMVDHIDIPITSTANLREGIKIPERAVGNKLRDVAYISSGKVYELSRITLEEISDYDSSIGRTNYNLDVFYIEGDKVKFVSNKSHADFIRFYFYMMPNDIVHEEDCGQIFSITDNLDDTTTIELVSIPDNYSNLPIMDLVSNKVPNKIIGYDIEPLNVNRTLKTVTIETASVPTGLSKGDYICEQFTSPYLNMPTEMHALLAQRASIFILEALNDTEGLKNALMRLNGMERSIQTTLEDRVEGAPQKINPRHTPLNQTFSGKGRGRS